MHYVLDVGNALFIPESTETVILRDVYFINVCLLGITVVMVITLKPHTQCGDVFCFKVQILFKKTHDMTVSRLDVLWYL